MCNIRYIFFVINNSGNDWAKLSFHNPWDTIFIELRRCDTRQFFLATCNATAFQEKKSGSLLQEKSPPATQLIIRLQVIQQLAYVYNSKGACNIFFTQICIASCKKKLLRVTAPLLHLDWSRGVQLAFYLLIYSKTQIFLNHYLVTLTLL